jgi:hypothetical protein
MENKEELNEQLEEIANEKRIDDLVKRLPHVRPGFVEEVKMMSREELQRRLLIGSDWIGSFSHSLDGIPRIAHLPGGGIDGCRLPRNIRDIVLYLVKERNNETV